MHANASAAPGTAMLVYCFLDIHQSLYSQSRLHVGFQYGGACAAVILIYARIDVYIYWRRAQQNSCLAVWQFTQEYTQQYSNNILKLATQQYTPQFSVYPCTMQEYTVDVNPQACTSGIRIVTCPQVAAPATAMVCFAVDVKEMSIAALVGDW